MVKIKICGLKRLEDIEIVNKYKGHLIATTACIGGELGTLILQLHECELVNDMTNASVYYQ